MAAIKVHGYPLSTATRRVLACLYEKGIDFEFVLVNMGTGEHKSDSFLALNPFGQVPAFEDGDLKLFESRAAANYVAHEYADKGTQLLIPGCSNKEAAVLELWKEVEGQQFNSPSSKVVWELFFKPFLGMTTDAAVVEENETALGKVLDVYEARLTRSKYLASDSFTLADLYHLPNIQCLLVTSAKKLFESRPHVDAWVKEITARPAWSKVLAMMKQ